MPETTSSSAAFIDAIKAGEFERVKAMVSADPTLIDARSRTGDSAILTAVYHRQKEIVNLLVARGARLSIFDACAAGETERVERLLGERESGAPGVNDYSPDRCTPRSPAITSSWPPCSSATAPTSTPPTRRAGARCTSRPPTTTWMRSRR